MREIKFRLWYKPYKEMRHAKNMFVGLGMVGWSSEHYCEPDDNEEDFEVMQYTGLKDKNGVEIYEGDILKHRYADAQIVIFLEGGFWPMCGEINAPNKPEEREVIGNIHENPELI